MDYRRLSFAAILAAASSLACAQLNVSSGGALQLEQACYDVQSYDIAIDVDPANKSITGTTGMIARTSNPTNVILLDLDDAFTVSKVTDGTTALRFTRQKDTLRVFFPASKQPGDMIKTVITYSGKPRIAKNAPWDGAMTWSKTKTGEPWISVTLQGEGADLLFPCKDHPSDRPSTATMRITVPSPLMAVGPGVLKDQKTANRKTTWTWYMGLPINNYSLVFNVGPYKVVEDTTKSVGGQTVPIKFYVLPDDVAKAPGLIGQLKQYLAYMEKYCGPYPFRTVKLGIVETPHLGMEHSTAIAYGNNFRYSADGFDWLLLHEFGHEWWANLITDVDWSDMWLHEGFQTYMDSMYQWEIHGKAAYLNTMKSKVSGLENKVAVAPREATPSDKIYGGDIYGKGALVLHSLRYLIGDDAFLKSIRHMAYPTKESETWVDGRAERIVTTDDYLNIAEKDSGKNLDWFFNVYVRQPKLPKLITSVEGNTMTLTWQVPDKLPFPMPVDVVIDGKTVRVPMTGGKGTVTFKSGTPAVDPDGWVLGAKG